MIRDGGGLETAERDYERRVLAYVAEWFRQHPGIRERCFMTAAAVLNGAEYQDISNAADDLERLVRGEITGSGPIPRGWNRPFSPRLERAEDIGARLHPSADGSRDGPLSVVELEESLVQAMVLAHLWYQHDDIFSHLFEWLDGLGQHPFFEVSGRAAAAASTLCVIDFTYLRLRLLEPWASKRSTAASPREHTSQISAAVALATAARESDLAAQILPLLHRWGGPGQPTGLPWTAATALGLLNERRFLAGALDGLGIIIEHHGWTLSWVAARSLANLCDAGHAGETLRTLKSWINAPSSRLAERALTVFDRLMQVRDAQPDDGEPERIPVLLRLAMSHEDTRDAVRQLWCDLLDPARPTVGHAALTTLYHLLRLADRDERCRPAADALFLRPLEERRTRWRTRSALRRCAFDHTPGSWTAAALLRESGTPLDRALDRIYQAWRFLVHRYR